MDLIVQLNKAIEYIEQYLTDEDALSRVAGVTVYSKYHFQRIFNYLADMPLGEYIRKRKLSVAIIDLQKGERVIDVAVKYGYNSADSFARAFEKQHGVTPTLARQYGVKYHIFPPITFQIMIKGVQKMVCRIEKKKAFEMFGVFGLISADMEQAFKEVKEFCLKCDEDDTVYNMNTLLDVDDCTMLHAALYDHTESNFKYMICQYVRDDLQIPEHYTRLQVPALEWAIFSVDDMNLPEMWRRIYTEWLPTSGYQIVGDINFEMYYGNARIGDQRGEIWLPVEHQ